MLIARHAPARFMLPSRGVPLSGARRRRLGDTTLPATIAANPRRWEAYAFVGAAVASAGAIVLQYRGHEAAAAALSVFAVLGGASIAAIRLLSEEQPQPAQTPFAP